MPRNLLAIVTYIFMFAFNTLKNSVLTLKREVRLWVVKGLAHDQTETVAEMRC